MVKIVSGPPTESLGLKMDVTRRRHDLLTLIEIGEYSPPVAFETRELLENWASSHNLKLADVKPANSVNTAEVFGAFRSQCWPQGACLLYRQVWVRKTYTNYRDVMRTTMRDLVTDIAALRAVDADPIIGRVVLDAFPEAWINIFPVWGRANQSFGWIEKRLPKPLSGFEAIFLTPLSAFKLLREDRDIRDSDDLNHQIGYARNRILSKGQLAPVFRADIERVVKDAYQGWSVSRGRRARRTPMHP